MRPEIADLTQFIMPSLSRFYDFPSLENQKDVLLETVPIKMGSSTKKADLVYFYQGTPIVLVEAKRENQNKNEAISQALSYIRNYPIENENYSKDGFRPKYFIISIAKDFEFFKHIYDIDNKGQVIDKYEQIEPQIFNKLLEEYGLVEGQPAKKLDKHAFSEFLGELLSIYNIESNFITRDIILDLSKQIYIYLKNPDHYYSHEPYINLDKYPERQARIRQLFEQYDILHSLNQEIALVYRDFILRAFQGLDFNQYITNSSVISLMVNLVNITEDSKILDFECGSGGFLVRALNSGAKVENIKGIDIDELPYIVTKTYMAIYSGLYSDDLEQIERIIKKDNGLFYYGDNWDIVIGNPAGGSEYIHGNEEKILDDGLQNLKGKSHKFSEYELSIQQAVRSVKIGGEICLILPEGFFSNSQDDFLRKYIAKYCKVLGIFSLPRGVFKKGTETKGLRSGSSVRHQKMSILYAKKIKEVVKDEELDVNFGSLDYPVFLASVDLPDNLEAKLSLVLKQWNSWVENQKLTDVTDEEIKEITKVIPKPLKEKLDKRQQKLLDIEIVEHGEKKKPKKSFSTKISDKLKDLFK